MLSLASRNQRVNSFADDVYMRQDGRIIRIIWKMVTTTCDIIHEWNEEMHGDGLSLKYPIPVGGWHQQGYVANNHQLFLYFFSLAEVGCACFIRPPTMNMSICYKQTCTLNIKDIPWGKFWENNQVNFPEGSLKKRNFFHHINLLLLLVYSYHWCAPNIIRPLISLGS